MNSIESAQTRWKECIERQNPTLTAPGLALERTHPDFVLSPQAESQSEYESKKLDRGRFPVGDESGKPEFVGFDMVQAIHSGGAYRGTITPFKKIWKRARYA